MYKLLIACESHDEEDSSAKTGVYLVR
jgi:hypothetical protein